MSFTRPATLAAMDMGSMVKELVTTSIWCMEQCKLKVMGTLLSSKAASDYFFFGPSATFEMDAHSATEESGRVVKTWYELVALPH